MQAGANEFGNDVGGNEMPRSEEEVGVRFHKGDGTETEPEVSGGGGGGGNCCCCGGVVVVVVVVVVLFVVVVGLVVVVVVVLFWLLLWWSFCTLCVFLFL